MSSPEILKYNRGIVLILMLCVCGIAYAQEGFLFSDDQELLPNSFWSDPAALHHSKMVISGPILVSSFLSDVDEPLSFDSDSRLSVLDFLNPLSGGQIITSESSGLDEALMKAADRATAPRFLSQRSRIFLLGISNAYNKKLGKELKDKNTWRFGITLERRSDFKYDAAFAEDYLDWVATPTDRIDEKSMTEVKLRSQTFAAVNAGQSIEILPLKLRLGYNAKFLMGLQRFESAYIKDKGMYLRQSGFESDTLGNLAFRDIAEPLGYGLGLDIGIHYRMTRTWSLNVSATDIGYIEWNRRTQIDTLSKTFEKLHSVAPLSNILSSDSTLHLVDSPISNDTYRSDLDGRFNIGFVYVDEGVRASVTGTKAFRNEEFRPDDLEGRVRVAYLFNRFGETKFELGIGYGYGTDSGSAGLATLKLLFPYLTLYGGTEGLGEIAGPYNEVYTFIGMQLQLDGKLRMRSI